ncbi:Hypothetical predicted protein [Octopus vulgaris]|uniref:Uncharacterized protein n=1 Tax=Octopus vulgaris TaxID=6645 RepID=A0AA36BJW4_OCTVU|nr:Hypothetical predicted protein [Octopus vulgaris]
MMQVVYPAYEDTFVVKQRKNNKQNSPSMRYCQMAGLMKKLRQLKKRRKEADDLTTISCTANHIEGSVLTSVCIPNQFSI